MLSFINARYLDNELTDIATFNLRNFIGCGSPAGAVGRVLHTTLKENLVYKYK